LDEVVAPGVAHGVVDLDLHGGLLGNLDTKSGRRLYGSPSAAPKVNTVKLDVIRVLDDDGRVVHPEREPKLGGGELRKLFRTIILVRILDERMLRLQRQGRLGFYLSSIGEEATHIGAAHALRPTDWLYPAYREVGAALFRGYDLGTFMCQMFGNAL